MKPDPKIGDQVIATIWPDGDPCDPFAYGELTRMEITNNATYYYVSGVQRAYRHCRKMTPKSAVLFHQVAPIISDRGTKSVYWWIRNHKAMQELIEEYNTL